MKTNGSRMVLCVLLLPLCLTAGCVALQAVARGKGGGGSLPRAKAGSISSVLIDKAERAYTVFMAIPAGKEDEVRSRIAGKPEVLIVEWSEFSRTKDLLISSNIVTNEYPRSRVAEGLYEMMGRAPGLPVGVTWNGGVAFTRNDYQYTKKAFARYQSSPADYVLTRPRLESVQPEAHFRPLLGW